MSLNDVDFSGRMQSARDAAAYQRHRGTAGSRPKFVKRRPEEDTPENRMAAELRDLRSELRDRENTIARLTGGFAEPDDFGAEFDRLCGSKVGGGLPSPAHVTTPELANEGNARRRKVTKRNPNIITINPLRDAVRDLLQKGLCSPAEAADLAGVSRQCVNYWAHGIDWRKARDKHLTAAWKQALKG